MTQTLTALCKRLFCPLASPESCHRQPVEIKKQWSQKNIQHTTYIAERKQISTSYHNSVCSDYYVWSLQVFLKQINAQYVSIQQDIACRLPSYKIELNSQRASSWPPPGPSVWLSQQHTHKVFWRGPCQEFLWTRTVPPQIVSPEM